MTIAELVTGTNLTHSGPSTWTGDRHRLGIHSVCNKPTRLTQPCISPGSLNRVPASAGVNAEMSPLSGGR